MKQYTTKQHKIISWFFLFTTAHMMLVTMGLWADVAETSTWMHQLFHASAWLFYSAFYVAISIVPLALVSLILPQLKQYFFPLLIVVTSAMLMFIRADLMIYDLYHFHFNGFIWNLVTTRGGLASLGTSDETYFSVALTSAGTVVIQILLWKISAAQLLQKIAQARLTAMVLLTVVAGVVQAVTYGFADAKNLASILDTAHVYPFFHPVTFTRFAEKMGVETTRRTVSRIHINGKSVHYPLSPVEFASVTHPPNIVFLVAESLRWDRLTPEIMPNVWQLAQKGQYFTNHYSSGNGTREGLFGMFYGLYGAYWSSFLHAQQPPLLVQRLHALDYQFDLRTSAHFSYPEFNKTIFASVPLTELHEASSKLQPWQRDAQNANEQIAFLKQRNPAKPFMTFFFFESTHARYTFPEEAVIASPYLNNINYWQMSRKSLKPKIGELKNRYTNAAHWVDRQMGRVIDALTQQGLLDNTIIIVTGDHGEEFLEKGYWGHNSSFVEEQTHTPMVIWMPGRPAQTVSRLTSHLDIAPTLLQALGAPANSAAYALGQNIFDESLREYIVISDWHSIGVQNSEMKYRIAYASHGSDYYRPTSANDEALSEALESDILTRYQPQLMDAMDKTSLFLAAHH